MGRNSTTIESFHQRVSDANATRAFRSALNELLLQKDSGSTVLSSWRVELAMVTTLESPTDRQDRNNNGGDADVGNANGGNNGGRITNSSTLLSYCVVGIAIIVLLVIFLVMVLTYVLRKTHRIYPLDFSPVVVQPSPVLVSAWCNQKVAQPSTCGMPFQVASSTPEIVWPEV